MVNNFYRNKTIDPLTLKKLGFWGLNLILDIHICKWENSDFEIDAQLQF